MVIILYILSIIFVLALGIVVMTLFNLDSKITAIYLLHIFPLNLIFYLPSLLTYFIVNPRIYQRFKLIFIHSPSILCAVFWFGGFVLYDYKKMDFTNFMIFGAPHLVWIILVSLFKKLL